MALNFKLGETRRRHKNIYYFPTALKPVFLVFLLAYICLLSTLLEYARRTLPVLRERPPIPGEIIPAATIPLTTETVGPTASKLGQGVVVLAPHPPTSAFQGIDVPAFSTAYWGLSIRDAWIHTLTTDRRGATRLTSVSAVGQDPYASGRCAMAVIEMSFTNNLEDCVALVERTLFHNHALQYNVHLLDSECFKRALEFDWANQQNWYWGDYYKPMLLFPACWEEEEKATTILTGVSNVFSGRTAVMTWNPNSITSRDSTASFVFVNTSTPGGWPIGFNQDRPCWEIASTPFHTFGTMVSAGPYYWPGSIPSSALDNTWMSQSVIRAYFTEDVWGEASPWGYGDGEAGPTAWQYYYDAVHQGCAVTNEASMTTSTESMVITSTAAQVPSRLTSGPVLAPSTSASTATPAPPTNSFESFATSTQVTSIPLAQTTPTSLTPSFSIATPSRQSSRSESSSWSNEGLSSATPEDPGSHSTQESHTMPGSSTVEISVNSTSPSAIEPTTIHTVSVQSWSQDQNNVSHSDFFAPGPVIRSKSSSAVQVLQMLPPSDTTTTQPGSRHWTAILGQGATSLRSSNTTSISVPASTSPLGTASDSVSTTMASLRSSEHAEHRAVKSSITGISANSSSRAQPSPSLIGDHVLVAPVALPSQSLTKNSSLVQVTTTLGHHTTPALVPMPQPPSPDSPPPVTKPSIRPMTNAEYLSGLLLPVLLCTLLTALIQILALNARSIFPFALLTRPSRGIHPGQNGAEAKDCVLLHLGGISGVFTSLRLLFQIREPLPFLLDLLVLLSVVLTAISTSTVTIGYFGFCDTGSHDGWCYMGVGYYSAMLYTAQGLLSAMGVVLLTVLALRSRLRVAINDGVGLGKRTSPWAVGNISRLSVTVPESDRDGGRVKGLRDLLDEIRSPALGGPGDDHVASKKVLLTHLGGYTFRIGSHRRRDGGERYGILAYKKNPGTPADQQGRSSTARGVEMVETHELQSIVTPREYYKTPLPDGFLSIAPDWDLNAASKRTSRTSQRSLLRTIASTPAMTEDYHVSARTSVDVASFRLPLQVTEQDHITRVPDRPTTPMPSPVTSRVLPVIVGVTSQSDEFHQFIASSSGHATSIVGEQQPYGTVFGPGSTHGSVMTFETQEYTQSVASGFSQRRLLQDPGTADATTSTFANVSTSIFPPSAPPPAVPLPPLPAGTSAIPIKTQHVPSSANRGSRRFKKFHINRHFLFQTIVLLLLMGLFILITYYESVEIDLAYLTRHELPFSLAASFEAFMDSQSIGVSVLFTSLAVGITLFWDYFFTWVVVDSQMAGYHHRVRRRQQLPRPHAACCLERNEGCFLLDMAAPAPPITVFDGFALSLRSFFTRRVQIRQRNGAKSELHRNNRRDPLVSLGAVSLAGILSKGIPILMSHIPFRQYQTWRLHLATAWMTVVILGYMVFVLGAYLALMVVAWARTRDRGGQGRVSVNEQMAKELGVKTDCIVGLVHYLMCVHEYHGDDVLVGRERVLGRS